MPAAPKVAYVAYDDGYRAIVSVKLIKDFKLASVAHCQKHKIYWKTNEAGHVDEGYYRGDVVLLGATFSDLIHQMGKKRLSVADTVFYNVESEEDTTEKKHWPAVPIAATNAAHLLIMAPINMRPPTGAFKRRSITGAPCRRYVRSENQAPPRRALTPRKMEAVGNAFSKYISGRPSEVAPIERLRKMNRFIAEMLNDLNK
ncbi:hypothetical protein MRX96_000778 [Rhipicephalus microplus]